MSPRRVLVAGGGVAGLETVIALRDHLGATIHIELLDPARTFVYRPMAVAEPFGHGAAREFDLARIAADHGVEHIRERLVSVEAGRRVAVTESGRERPWDRLVVATGAKATVGVPGALTFRGPEDAGRLGAVLEDLEHGRASSIAFIVPAGVAWALPIYELALMTADRLAQDRRKARLVIVTSERVPLAAFGRDTGERFAAMLADRGVDVHASVAAESFAGGAVQVGEAGPIPADRAVALPRLTGRWIPGLPHDADGFIPTDRHGAVPGAPDVYAIGDGTTFPIKQGGIAAQQADAAAAAIAAGLGAPVEARPFRPVLRALLLDGHHPRFLRAEPRGDRTREGDFSTAPLWWPPSKVAARFLAPYLADPGGQIAGDASLTDREPRPGSAQELDAEHHDVAELALTLADENARWGEFGLALRCLDAVETLEGVLPSGYAAKRHEWERRLHPGRRR